MSKVVDFPFRYTELPRKSHVHLPTSDLSGLKKTISQYFTTMECVCCGDLTHSGVCERCRSNPQLLITSLMNKIHSWEKTHLSITKVIIITLYSYIQITVLVFREVF